ncbi:hypothetical protein LEMLEM_LOCUS21076 [Lemmus lemmus]
MVSSIVMSNPLTFCWMSGARSSSVTLASVAALLTLRPKLGVLAVLPTWL